MATKAVEMNMVPLSDSLPDLAHLSRFIEFHHATARHTAAPVGSTMVRGSEMRCWLKATKP